MRPLAAALVSLLVAACTSSEPAPAPATADAGTTPLQTNNPATQHVIDGLGIPARMWLLGVRATLPSALCGNEFFRTCFPRAMNDCTDHARRAFDECVAQMPHVIPRAPNASNGAEAGAVLGQCSGTELQRGLERAGLRDRGTECTRIEQTLLREMAAARP